MQCGVGGGAATDAAHEAFFFGHAAAGLHRFFIADGDDFVNHIDHAVKVAGIDHVGIGTDFDGGGGVKGFNDHSEALNVTVELVRRGYTEEQIRKIWGGNLMRVWREVNRVAGK